MNQKINAQFSLMICVMGISNLNCTRQVPMYHWTTNSTVQPTLTNKTGLQRFDLHRGRLTSHLSKVPEQRLPLVNGLDLSSVKIGGHDLGPGRCGHHRW